MNYKWKLALSLGVALAGTAFALSVPFTFTSAIERFPGFIGPGVVQFQEVTLKPGESTGWHHHEGPATVILAKGRNVTEDHGCGPDRVQPGIAFAESANKTHRVDNNGPGLAIIYWSTVYPEGSSPTIPDDIAPPCTP